MKATLPLIALASLALTGLSGTASAADNNPASTPLRPVSACLEIARVNEWYVPDDRTLIARTGPKHFRIDLKGACPRLDKGNSARMVSSDAPDTRGRMCGDLGEKVVNGDGLPCAVGSVSRIDAATFKALEKQAIDGPQPTTTH